MTTLTNEDMRLADMVDAVPAAEREEECRELAPDFAVHMQSYKELDGTWFDGWHAKWTRDGVEHGLRIRGIDPARKNALVTGCLISMLRAASR